MATVVCEKHGLRFDPERADGCVLCRREAGGTATPRAARLGDGRSGSIGLAVVLTFAIWVVAGLLLFGAHRAVADRFRQWGASGQQTGFDQADAEWRNADDASLGSGDEATVSADYDDDSEEGD